MLPAALAIIAGLCGLLWGADRFVAGSAGAARNFGIAPLVIGLTIVALGTSAPEIIVAIDASLKNAGELAIGNAIGSNLANIGMVLGITALVAPLPTQKHLLVQETPVLLAITLIAGLLLMDNQWGYFDGYFLLGLLIPLLWLTIRYKKQTLSPAEIEAEEEELPSITTKSAILWFIVGLAILLISSELLVWGAMEVAQHFEVSQLVIGLTIVAVGTSLPELATSVMSALRGHHDIALGNIFGSNLFNIMAVMTMPGIISPLELSESVFQRDYIAMLIITLSLAVSIFIVLHRSKKTHQPAMLGRAFGVIMLALYGLYYVILLQSTP
jgi:cation:H+ antiporter